MTNYTLRRASFSLAEFAIGDWKQHLALQDRNKIRHYMSAMLTRCIVSRYCLSPSDLKVRNYSTLVENYIFQNATSEVDYFSKIMFKLSNLIGLVTDMVHVILSNEPVQEQYLTFPELNYTTVPFRPPAHSELELITRDERFLDILHWISSLDRDGHSLLKRKEIDVIKDEIYTMSWELRRPISLDRLQVISKRFWEIRKMKYSLQDIDATLRIDPDPIFRFRLKEFLKAWLLEKAIKQGIQIPWSIGSGLVRHCFYGEILSVADVWVGCKLRAWPAPRNLAPDPPLPQQ